jgi:Flp pilus assembly protein TadD
VNRRDHRVTNSRAASDRVDAASTSALYEAGLDHLRARRNLDALIYCKKALALDPDSADALHLMGLLSLETGHCDLAVEWIASAIRRSPEAKYLSSLGTAFRRQGKRKEALKAFGKAVQLTPDDPVLWANLGIVLDELQCLSDAVLCFQHALRLDPHQLEAACWSAVLLYQLGRGEEARAHVRRIPSS